MLTCIQGFRFAVGNEVWIKATTAQGLRGPYFVTETHPGPSYTLEESDGTPVDDEKKFAEVELDPV